MRLLNLTGRVMMAAMLVVTLTACGKKKNGSTASTPGSTCSWNGYQMVNAQGLPCSTTGQTICPVNGINPANGQQCVPGQPIYPTNPQYPHQQYPQQAWGCQQWTQMYGIQYVPVLLQGQYQCVRIDLLQGYTYNTPYYDYGYEYYYAYPPYSGSGCSTQIDFGGSWGNIGICF